MPIQPPKASFLIRFYTYQQERFPLLVHGILITTFSFSAVAYSRICRGVSGFIDLPTFGWGVFNTITLFLMLRIFDEFKDAEDDALYRKDLPVPRGLVTLGELRVLGIALVLAQIVVNALVFPKMLWLYVLVFGYMSLMAKEFFIATWLKKRQFWYVVSHMLIIPLVDMYASGLDWFLAGVEAPKGLLFFFAVSFMNGIVLEIGRKIRIPTQESEGVLTYSGMLGANNAVYIWLLMLLVTFGCSVGACYWAKFETVAYLILLVLLGICALPALLFVGKKTAKRAKMIEYASALWTVMMYLTLGAFFR
jgi:4-hydroxybenzoate polyprenyltransferase